MDFVDPTGPPSPRTATIFPAPTDCLAFSPGLNGVRAMVQVKIPSPATPYATNFFEPSLDFFLFERKFLFEDALETFRQARFCPPTRHSVTEFHLRKFQLISIGTWRKAIKVAVVFPPPSHSCCWK